MSIDPRELETRPQIIEAIEKATMRLVTQAVYEYRDQAALIFSEEQDLVADIGEDVTREALDKMGVSRIDTRLFGKIDYKRARYIFHPEWAIRQALFVDSKAEDTSGRGTATIQTGQTSLEIRQRRRGEDVAEPGGLPPVYIREGIAYITTTVFVKYSYESIKGVDPSRKRLVEIAISALPNGWLQDLYNPHGDDSIWRAGRDAPTRGELFRVRFSFAGLKSKASWRVQRIHLHPEAKFKWDD